LAFPNERFGYHVVYDRDIHDAIEFAAGHGFGLIVPDLMIPRFWPERFDGEERRRIRRHSEDRGVSISFHAPSDYLSLGTPYPEVRKAILERMRLCLDLAQDVGAERRTVHPSPPYNFAIGGRPGPYVEGHRDLYGEALREGIGGVLEEADGVQVCVENDGLTPLVEAVLEGLLAEEPGLFLTLDIPKACDPRMGAPTERVEAFYSRNLGRVREAHLHDRRPGGAYHDVLGQGVIDHASFLRMLAPHDLHFNLEIRPRENAYTSLLWLKNLWKEIF
jgi:sugar phosphate isomerase/epimerase